MRLLFSILLVIFATIGFSTTILDYETVASFSDVIVDPTENDTKALVFYFDRCAIESHPQLFNLSLREDAIGALLIQVVGSSPADNLPVQVEIEYDYTPLEGYERVSGYLLNTFLRFYSGGEELGGKSDCGDCGSPLAKGTKSFELGKSRGVLGGAGIWIQFFSAEIDPFREYTFTLDWFILGQRVRKEVFFLPETEPVQFCHWDSSLLMQIPQAFMLVVCTAIESPLTLRVKPITDDMESFLVTIDGIVLLSDTRENPEAVIAFNETYLSGKTLFLSHPDYLTLEELQEHLLSKPSAPALVWKAGTESEIPEILWNLALITNGFSAIDGSNLVLSPLLKICGCQ